MEIAKDCKLLYVVASGAREIAVFSIGAAFAGTERFFNMNPFIPRTLEGFWCKWREA